MKINEIFSAIEGETSLTGLPMLFVRFTGCPLRCRFCDTTYAYDEGEDMSVEALIRKIDDHKLSIVHLTGGEPLIQRDLPLLVHRLREKGYRIVIETSGARDISPYVLENTHIMLDIKTPGSGMEEHNMPDNFKHMRTGIDEFKFAVCHRQDYEWTVTFMEKYRLSDTGCIINLSPVTPDLPAQTLARWILNDRLPVRLNCQLHRFLWPDKNRGV